MKRIAIAAAMFMVGASPALANECPLLHQQVVAESQRRLDAGAYTAKQLAAEGEKFHADGKHAESVVKYEEAAKAVGITLTHKK